MSIHIVDTTLRDGEQTPGVLFSLDEKIDIAIQLDRAGVQYIEAGTPANGKSEQDAVREIINLGLEAEIITWNRALRQDIDCSLEIGARYIHISLPVSDIMIDNKLDRSRGWILNQLEIACEYLKQAGVLFSVGAEDATRANTCFLKDYAMTAENLGAHRIRICDTVGISDPFTIAKLISPLQKGLKTPLEIHAHNDLGMATANALVAARTGVTAVDTTVIGLGERAGNTPLEEIIMALKLNMGIDTSVRLSMMKELAETVSLAARRPIAQNKCVVGAGIFTHESGIHVDGVRKNPVTYEPFHPELVGAKRRFIIGKHSGPKAVFLRLKELGISLESGTADQILKSIRQVAASQKGGITDHQLLSTVWGKKNSRQTGVSRQ